MSAARNKPMAVATGPLSSGPLLDQVSRWLSSHDPGGIDTTRALHLAVSFIAVILLAHATAERFAPQLSVLFPMAGAMTALILISLTPAASRATEARSFAKLFGIIVAVLLLVFAIGPGDHPSHALMMKLVLVPLTGIALYLRRYGMEGMRQGVGLIIIATVAAVLEPTRAQTLWLLLAACEGMVVASLVRFSFYRPSAMRAYEASVEEAGMAIGAYLHEVGTAVRENRPMPLATDDLLDTIRLRVRAALTNASAEVPEARGYLEAVRSLAYRLRVATQLVAENMPTAHLADHAASTVWRQPLAAAADQLARHLESGIAHPFPERDRMRNLLVRLRQAAMSDNLPAAQQLALLRAAAALVRISLVVNELSAITMAGAEAWRDTNPAPPPPPPATPAPGLSPFTKVALQGLLATAITTVLDFTLDLNHAYWATMTVMFVLGNSVGETYVRVRYRTVGTLAGVVVGLGVLLAFDQYVWLLAGICLICQMIGVVTLRDRYDVASAATGLSVVLALHLVTGLGTEGMIARIYETAIGAVVALIVSRLLLPVYVADQIRAQITSMVRRSRTAFARSWPHSNETPGEDSLNVTAAMSLELRVLADRLPHLGAESSLGRRNAGDIISLVSTLEILTTYVALLEDAAHRLAALHPPEGLVTVMEAARSRTLKAFDIALGEAPAQTTRPSGSELEAAISVALDLAADVEIRRTLPFIADYLSFTDAVLRPLADIGSVLAATAPRPAAASAPPATSGAPRVG